MTCKQAGGLTGGTLGECVDGHSWISEAGWAKKCFSLRFCIGVLQRNQCVYVQKRFMITSGSHDYGDSKLEDQESPSGSSSLAGRFKTQEEMFPFKSKGKKKTNKQPQTPTNPKVPV